MKHITFLLIALLLVAQSVSAQEIFQKDKKIAETDFFEFHSNYYLNLHSYLVKKGLMYSKGQTQFDSLFRAEIKSSVSESMKADIMHAVKFYADSISPKNLLLDEELTAIKYAMEQSTDMNELKKKVNNPVLMQELLLADKFFMQYVWKETDNRNSYFVTSKTEMIKKIEAAAVKDFEKVYGYKYDGKKFRVDMVDYATFFGAYTTVEPYINATVSATDKRHEETQGVEVIFHEVSHGMIDSVYKIQQKLCEEQKIRVDHNVWHTILFYSTGTIVKQQLKANGIDHELYIYKNKMADLHPSVKKAIDATVEFWQPYLDGKTDMETAIKNILAATK